MNPEAIYNLYLLIVVVIGLLLIIGEGETRVGMVPGPVYR